MPYLLGLLVPPFALYSALVSFLGVLTSGVSAAAFLALKSSTDSPALAALNSSPTSFMYFLVASPASLTDFLTVVAASPVFFTTFPNTFAASLSLAGDSFIAAALGSSWISCLAK